MVDNNMKIERSDSVQMTLKMLRTKFNLTQEEAAKKVGVSTLTWANWENEKSFPNVRKIKEIEKEFGVKYNDIIFLNHITVKT